MDVVFALRFDEVTRRTADPEGGQRRQGNMFLNPHLRQDYQTGSWLLALLALVSEDYLDIQSATIDDINNLLGGL